MAEVKLGNTVQPYEKEYFRKDGSRVPVLAGSTIFEEGRTEGVAFVDLTERMQAEADARDSDDATRCRWRWPNANRVATMGQLTTLDRP
jgi:hypothetical protein